MTKNDDLLNFNLPDGTPYLEYIERTLGTADDDGEGTDRSEDVLRFDWFPHPDGDMPGILTGIPPEDEIYAMLCEFKTSRDIAEAAVKLLKILAVKDAGYGHIAQRFWNWRREMEHYGLTWHQMALHIISEKGHDELAGNAWWEATKRAVRRHYSTAGNINMGSARMLALLLEAM